MNLQIDYQIVATGKRKFSFREAGEGPTLVLLHGIGSNAGSWCNQLVTLSDHFRVVAWDTPGYGESTPLNEPQPLARDYADALAIFLDVMQIQECCLVGHSLGTLIAAAFVRNYARTSALVLASCAMGYRMQPDDPVPEKIVERLQNLEVLGPEGMAQARAAHLLSKTAVQEQVDQVREAMAQIIPDGYRQATMMLAQGDLEADAVQVQTPCLVLCGTDDQITPEGLSQRIAEVIAGSQYQPLKGAGHLCYIEQPETFNSALRNFFLSQPR